MRTRRIPLLVAVPLVVVAVLVGVALLLPPRRPPFRFLEGLKPTETTENWHMYVLPGSHDQVLAKVESELTKESGWQMSGTSDYSDGTSSDGYASDQSPWRIEVFYPETSIDIGAGKQKAVQIGAHMPAEKQGFISRLRSWLGL